MSSINDYVASSNNSINENNYNAKKARSKIHQIKQLLRPVFALLKKNSRKNTYKKSPQPEYFIDEEENAQNLANELLEQRIFQEIDSCPEFAAVPVYNANGTMDITPVYPGQQYIPVHFAKTDAGTFFWTSVYAADSDICYSSPGVSEHQVPECQVPSDRWAQA